MSRYDLFRRRIAPIAFVLALGLLIKQSCDGNGRLHATLVFELGADRAAAQAIDVDILVGGESAGYLHRTREFAGGFDPARTAFPISLPVADAELHIDLDLGGHHRLVTRAIHVPADAATIVVKL